jgi:hypothetical protein
MPHVRFIQTGRWANKRERAFLAKDLGSFECQESNFGMRRESQRAEGGQGERLDKATGGIQDEKHAVKSDGTWFDGLCDCIQKYSLYFI